LPTKTTLGTLPSVGHQVPWHQWQQQRSVPNNTSRHYKKKLQKPDRNHAYEGLLSLLQGMLRRMDSMSNTQSHLPRVQQGWVRKDEIIHPLRGVDSPSIGAVSPCLGVWFLNPSAYQVCLHCIDCHILYILFLPYILFEEPSFLSLDFLLVALRIFCRYILRMTEKACHCFSVLV